MREKHLTAEEIIKYMDTSDMSEDYLLWMEETTEHLQACDVCQKRLHRAMTAESVCEEEGLAAGLELMEHEEEIRRNILIAQLGRMREQERIAELITRIRDGYVERFMFSAPIPQGKAAAVRGADAGGVMDDNAAGKQKVTLEQRVTLERSEDKLLLKIPGRLGSENQAGRENSSGTAKICDKLMVIFQMEDEEPIIKEALWDETCGQYVAVVDGFTRVEKLEVYLLQE